MSKRTGFQFRQPRSKMPKLDITISSSQRNPVAGTSNMNQQRPAPDIPTQPEDAWGEDEEDEFLILASQAVEQVQANAAVVISQSMNIRDHDMSYTNFRQNARAPQSTQLHQIDEFDNDDDLFSNVPDIFPNLIQPPTIATENRVNDFQIPQSQIKQNNSRVSSDSNKAREHKEKIQNDYFNEKIKAQKKQIETLKETLNKVNQKCTTKEGEASTLRYEVDTKSREIDRLRRERMEESVDVEKKYSEKITALEKKLEEQRCELEFKNIEILNKKSRRSLNDSVVMEPESSIQSFEMHHLFRLHSNYFTFEEPTNIPAANFLTSKSFERYRGISERDFDILKCLSALQSIYNGAKSNKLQMLDDNMMTEFTVIMNAFITTLKNYGNRLPLRTPTKYDPVLEHKILAEAMTKITISEDEKLMYEKQIIAVIALLCTHFSNITRSLLFDKCEAGSDDDDDDEINGESTVGTFVDILADVLCNIGLSEIVSQHQGFIESASLLLVALAKTYSPTNKGDMLLLNLFQAIVFCEPDLCSLNHLSEFLELISENTSSSICHRFCVNETNNNVYVTMASMQRLKIRRFTIETCPLQVFSFLLQISFTSNGCDRSTSDQSNEVNTIINITIRMMKFLRNCFNRRVNWLFRKDENADETQVQVSHCYCNVVSCIIILLHFCINRKMGYNDKIGLRKIQTLFASGILFLYDIINKHYESKMVTLGGLSVITRLQAVYDWINHYVQFHPHSAIFENAKNIVHLRKIAQLNEPQMIYTDMRSSASDQTDSILMDSFTEFLL